MKFYSWLSPSARNHPPFLQLGLLLTSLAQLSWTFSFKAAPAANLDLSHLGRVGLVGDFSGISLYQFEGQNENGFSTNGSQALLSQFPNGGFATLASADAGIQAMCSFVMQNGKMAGIIVGGNFTSLGGIESPGAAMFNPNTSTVVPLTGLSGQVAALLCDEPTNTVYVGGSFKGANSTNAIAWVGTAGWTNLPFAGFNGPVTSISKASNGHIIFGGSFTGLGNATGPGPSSPDQQIINLSGATILATASTTTSGLSDPTNIICKTNGTDGSGNTWLLADGTPGSWNAKFGFGFEPTKLRLWNTHLNGRGTKTWRFTALPINGIMNFTYTDPATGQEASCSSECPLSSDTSVQFQDFHFVNVIGMYAFQIDISDWYGSGGGLDGVELFEDDIFAYAINSFNEPTCAGIESPSSASLTGPWTVSPSLQSSSEYLTATISESGSASVIFLPDIKQSGNYSVNLYTPGCIQDNSCSSRGIVNITGTMTSGKTNTGFGTQLYQTNNFDKYDQIYFGYIEAGSSSFRPSVTLTPSSGQNFTNLSVVAQRVGFTLISSGGNLNGLFEYDPTQAVVNTANFTNSAFDQLGMSLGTGTLVNTLTTSGSNTFVGGKFTSSTDNNIVQVTSAGTTSLSDAGLNGEVISMFLNQTLLYVGGQFTGTVTGGNNTALSNCAAYDTSRNTWSALGAGVNGMVTSVVPLLMNVTSTVPETVITFTGDFNEILAFGSYQPIPVTGFAVWVPSHNNWLQNLNVTTLGINGELTAFVGLPGGGTLFAGSLSSSQLVTNGAASLSSGLGTLPLHIQPPQSQSSASVQKRDAAVQNVSGVVTGLFYENGGRNVTVLGGHFSATGSNGSDVHNLVFINGSNSDAVTGVGSQISEDSAILALALQGDNLFAGGSLTGTVNGEKVTGLISYNLLTSSANSQPPTLGGSSVTVNTIAVRPTIGDVYVGGSFSSAGSLDCPGVCVFTNATSQWNRPGSNLGGIANSMIWASEKLLIVGGSLMVNGENISLASYDVTSQTWTAVTGATIIPGPVTTLAAANSDASQIWVAGTATNGSAFLLKFDGTTWTSVSDSLGSGTTIQGLRVLSLTENHSGSSLVPSGQTLMVTGSLNLIGFGNASATLFNGKTFQPFILTSTTVNTGGSVSQIFTQEQDFFTSSGGHLAIGFIILIALAISLALIFILVVGGVFAERIRRKREGYMPAPTASFDRNHGLSRIPPHQLFSSLGRGRGEMGKAPVI